MKTRKFPIRDIKHPVFYTGDLVELLNVSPGQDYDIKSQTSDFKQDTNRLVGQRFYVECFVRDYSFETKLLPLEIQHRLQGWSAGGHGANSVSGFQIKLHSRPIRNKIKFFIQYIIGTYKP